MPHVFVFSVRNYRKESLPRYDNEGSPKTMSWTRSGHTRRPNSKHHHNLPRPFTPRFRLNRFKLGSNWVMCKRRKTLSKSPFVRSNKVAPSEKFDNAKCELVDNISFVTRYKLMMRNQTISRTHSNTLPLLEKGASEIQRDSEKQGVLCKLPDESDQTTLSLSSDHNYVFEEETKWKEMCLSFLNCPYSDGHNLLKFSKDFILMKTQKKESYQTVDFRGPGQPPSSDKQNCEISPKTTSVNFENLNCINKSSKLIILKATDSTNIKSTPILTVPKPVIMHNPLLYHQSSYNHQNSHPPSPAILDKTCSINSPIITPTPTLQSNNKKCWSLFRISNGSVVPLCWMQNGSTPSNNLKSEQQTNDLNVNNANWFTKSVLSNMVSTETEQPQPLLKRLPSPLSTKKNLLSIGQPANGISLPNNDFGHRESDSQKLVRSCHEFVYDNSGTQIHRCRSCCKLFSSFAAFYDHVVSTHNQAKNRCGVCHKHFSRSWLLKGHMRTHTGERPYKCHHPGCNKAFADKSNLRSHTLIHTVVGKKFVCQRCQRAFAQKRYLHKHQFEVCKILS